MVILAAAALALAAQTPDFSWSGPLAAGKRFTVKNIQGDVLVESARAGTLEITALKRPGRRGDPEDVIIRRVETSRGIEVCVVYPGMRDGDDDDCDWSGTGRGRRGRHEENDTRVDFTIRLPQGVHLDGSTVSGDVRARGLRGEVEVHSVSGDVEVRDATGPSLEAKTVSGDVLLEDISAALVGAETVSGDVRFSGDVKAKGDYDFQTLSGDVELRLPAGIGAEITASTFSGDFDSSFPIASKIQSSRRGQRRRIAGTIGQGEGGGATIRVESFSGDVTIRERAGRS